MTADLNPLPHLVLLGGGHTHALLLKLLQEKCNRPFSKITMVSDKRLTAYSGMVPGFIEGVYSSDDIHIDLSALCKNQEVDFIEAKITGLNTTQNSVTLDSGACLSFDILSINTGSKTRDLLDPSNRWGISVKPMNRFITKWQTDTLPWLSSTTPKNIGVVGGGAAGFEIAMALQTRLGSMHHLTWMFSGEAPLKNTTLGKRLLKVAASRNIKIETHFKAIERDHNSVVSSLGKRISCDVAFYCMGAEADRWPQHSGMDLTHLQFIKTNSYLQCLKHKHIFASGDVASQEGTKTPKAGVYAVRQAPILHKNLVNYSRGKNLEAFVPQKDFLALLSTGNKSAIGVKQGWTFEGRWVWYLKNYIDKKFMNQFP